MSEMTLNDLVDEAGDAAAENQSPEKSTGEWISETVETLDKRGLLEPMLFGPEGAKEVQDSNVEQAKAENDGDGDGDAPDIDAESIATAGEAVMDQLGDDVTVAELVQICRDNPALVDKQIQENL